MKTRKKQKKRVPEVLLRRFGTRARTLASTVAALVPRPRPQLLNPSSCLCKGRSCLLCCNDAISFLLRPGDPGDYRYLLHRTFVVVNDGAPPIFRFHPAARWPLKQVIENTILLMLREEPKTSNLVCSRNTQAQKRNTSSMALEILTTSAWDCLLERVGDELMIYLLKYTSIFLPLPSGEHRQVAGPPISKLRPMFRKRDPEPQRQHPSVIQYAKSTGATAAAYKQSLDVDLQHNSDQLEMGHGKRKRASKMMWPQERKRRKLNFSMGGDTTPYNSAPAGGSNSSGKPQSTSNSSCESDCGDEVQVRCCCHLIFKTPQLVSHRHQIDRRHMFYNSEYYSSVLPRKHILNVTEPDFKFLVEKVFGVPQDSFSDQLTSCIHGREYYCYESTCLYHSLIKLLKTLVRKKDWCQYKKLLDKHCNIEHESAKPCQRHQVLLFIWDVCRTIVPPELLGAPSSRKILLGNIDRFLRLRRFEKFSLSQCMHELKTSAFPFLHSTGQNVTLHMEEFGLVGSISNVKLKLFANWIFWLFSSLVVPLVQLHFYVTETEDGRQDICYYRKSVWNRLTNKVITCVEGKTYKKMDEAAVTQIIKQRSFGFSKVRLRPKKDNARMLANLKLPSRLSARGSLLKVRSRGTNANGLLREKLKPVIFKSVNSALRDAHAVLKGLRVKNPEKLGSSVFNSYDLHRKICSFVIFLKNESTTMPGLYMLVSDVSNAFDSIKQDKLLSVMEDVMKEEDQYRLQQSSQVVCSTKSLWTRENLRLIDKSTGSGSTSFTPSAQFGSSHSVLVNQGLSRSVRKADIFLKLEELVKHNIILLNGNFYQQTMGIPHGSVLSSLLCSLYLGHMENNVIFPFLERGCKYITGELSKRVNGSDASAMENSRVDTVISPPKYLLLRFHDDFLFISTSKELASGFFSRLDRGFLDYNCYMNKHKLCASFNVEHQSTLTSSKKIHVGEDGTKFLQWNGMLINCSTFEVQCDFTRHLVNHLRSTLTIRWHGKPYEYLKSRLLNYLRMKWHAIFSDSNINSAAVIRLNIFQAFLVCAMKFHSYLSELSQFHNVQPIFYLRIIEQSLRYMNGLIKRRIRAFSRVSEFPPIAPVPENEIKWLGLSAFIQALKRKQSRYRDLLAMLSSKHSELSLKMNASSDLEFAVKKSHSSLLWKINY